MFGMYWIYACFIKQYLPINNEWKTILGLVMLYVLGLGLFVRITHKIPIFLYEKKKISFQSILLCFLLYFNLHIDLCLCQQFGRLPRWLCGKESACQCRRCKRCGFNPWVGKIPWRRAWQPTPVFLPGESHGQRSLVGYSPSGRKEQDMTEATERASDL